MKPETISLQHSKAEATFALHLIEKVYRLITKAVIKRKYTQKVLTRVGAEVYARCATSNAADAQKMARFYIYRATKYPLIR